MPAIDPEIELFTHVAPTRYLTFRKTFPDTDPEFGSGLMLIFEVSVTLAVERSEFVGGKGAVTAHFVGYAPFDIGGELHVPFDEASEEVYIERATSIAHQLLRLMGLATLHAEGCPEHLLPKWEEDNAS